MNYPLYKIVLLMLLVKISYTWYDDYTAMLII